MQQHGFSESDSQRKELEEYRSVSPLALVTLALGIASVLAVGSPSLWVIPVLAVGSAVWAFRDLQRNSASRMGRKAAMAGLLLALFFGGFAPTRLFLDRIIHVRQARRVAERWFQAIRDQQPAQAYLLMMEPPARSAKMGISAALLADDEAFQNQMDEKFGVTPYTELIAAAPDLEARFVRSELDAKTRQGRVLHLRYDVHWTGQDKSPTSLVVDLGLHPDRLPLSHPDRWQIRQVQVARDS